MSDVERSVAQAQVSVPATPAPGRYREHKVPRGPYHLYASDYPGEGPAIVLLHGFPDNLHLYDRLVPELPQRRVVTFDFLGWGDQTSPPATRTPPQTRPATSTPSSST
jgi:pimeloyl-ACP methyl ester carboxylesterase